MTRLNGSSAIEQRLDGIETQLDEVVTQLKAVHAALPGGPAPLSRNQERLEVAD